MLVAITGVLGLIPPIPVPIIPVPITLQTLGVMLAGSLLGPKKGFFSMFLFVLLVAIGIPLLSGGRGGLGVLLGPSGGYILSWPIAALMIGWLIGRMKNVNMKNLLTINVAGGILLIYLCGSAWFAFITDLPFLPSFMANIAFVPGDLTKAVLTAFLTIKIRQAGVLPLQRQLNRQEISR